jgi:spermidine synthase
MFFLSGMGALVFETVWFSQLGLVVGNAVWSAALVTGAFMAGLALGNAGAIRIARRWGDALRCYGMAEVAAALSGAALVLLLPLLPGAFAPLFARLVDGPWLQPARLGIAFGLLLIPAAALGATLPLLARPLEAAAGGYGAALGRLYGVNTLGAVAGTLGAALLLVPALGLKASGLVAAGCNLCAALIAFRVAPAFPAVAPGSADASPAARPGSGRARLLAAAFLAGATLLALEVVWIRFLLLFTPGTVVVFAIMLATVLAGIALGGLAGGRSLPVAAAALAAAGASVGVVAGYGGFEGLLAWCASWQAGLPAVAMLALFLMLPVSFASGVLFTVLGARLRECAPDATRTTAQLAAANTVGAMTGSFAAAFVLLPGLGMERSFFALACIYVLIALLAGPGVAAWRPLAAVGCAALVLAFFPFGRMAAVHYPQVAERYGARLVAAREGLVESAFYLVHESAGNASYFRLATNSYSMSATSPESQRYMRLFAYLPEALRPGIERALLLCFGVGVTADAITELPALKSLDVVDVSRDILELSTIAYPDPARHPLRDPRVATHLEDGRFFLQQSRRRYDLITGEPPPPKVAGMASLYAREQFDLIRRHLNPGGIATYWLPVHQLNERDALAIIRAFCDAFEDCSLWAGSRLDWILLGSQDGLAPVRAGAGAALWSAGRARDGLVRIGIDRPERLYALFMADAAVLKSVSGGVPPLVDDFPQRISATLPAERPEPLFVRLIDGARSRQAFEKSAWIARLVPPATANASLPYFHERWLMDAAQVPGLAAPAAPN